MGRLGAMKFILDKQRNFRQGYCQANDWLQRVWLGSQLLWVGTACQVPRCHSWGARGRVGSNQIVQHSENILDKTSSRMGLCFWKEILTSRGSCTLGSPQAACCMAPRSASTPPRPSRCRWCWRAAAAESWVENRQVKMRVLSSDNQHIRGEKKEHGHSWNQGKTRLRSKHHDLQDRFKRGSPREGRAANCLSFCSCVFRAHTMGEALSTCAHDEVSEWKTREKSIGGTAPSSLLRKEALSATVKKLKTNVLMTIIVFFDRKLLIRIWTEWRGESCQ